MFLFPSNNNNLVVQGATDLEANDAHYPSWGSWKSTERYLPRVFHTKDGFLDCAYKLKDGVPKETYHHLEHFSLVVGLAIRDINIVSVHESHEVLPEWVATSILREKHVAWILKCCPPKISETSLPSKYVFSYSNPHVTGLHIDNLGKRESFHLGQEQLGLLQLSLYIIA